MTKQRKQQVHNAIGICNRNTCELGGSRLIKRNPLEGMMLKLNPEELDNYQQNWGEDEKEFVFQAEG